MKRNDCRRSALDAFFRTRRRRRYFGVDSTQAAFSERVKRRARPGRRVARRSRDRWRAPRRSDLNRQFWRISSNGQAHFARKRNDSRRRSSLPQARRTQRDQKGNASSRKLRKAERNETSRSPSRRTPRRSRFEDGRSLIFRRQNARYFYLLQTLKPSLFLRRGRLSFCERRVRKTPLLRRAAFFLASAFRSRSQARFREGETVVFRLFPKIYLKFARRTGILNETARLLGGFLQLVAKGVAINGSKKRKDEKRRCVAKRSLYGTSKTELEKKRVAMRRRRGGPLRRRRF